jgi:gliding motility-associated-like protein
LGSNKFPVGLCAPVNANVTYNVSFTSAVPSGTLELVYDWGDGSAQEVITLSAGDTKYQASRFHNFPSESDCEYQVAITMRYNGKFCTATRQLQKIASWRTDEYNGGSIGLLSPSTKLTEHVVCEGDNIDVVFTDESKWNCNAQYVQTPPNVIESPNVESRWQQIIYNTNVPGSKIPNVQVDGIPVTGSGGVDILGNYKDPSGIAYMASPVYVDDARRRSALRITAPGGLGTGFPKAGDVFAITLRYWNFCNPYDDPNIPGPPSDAENGDHAPIVKTSYIKIAAPPAAPTVAHQVVCNGTTPTAFSVTNVPVADVVRWYENIPNPDRPGKLIAISKTLPVTAHPDWKNNTTAATFKVWVSRQPTTAGTTNCESPKALEIRAIRESLSVPDPVMPVPAEVCNNSILSIALPPAPAEAVGGSTSYLWTGSNGLALTSSSSASTATFAINIASFGAAMYVDRTITVSRQFTSTPTCAKTKTFNIRIYKPAVGGTLSSVPDVCENVEVSPISLTGNFGDIVRWEVKRDAGNYVTYSGVATGSTISPGILLPGKHAFRAVMSNGACNEVYSSEEVIEVFRQPVHANAGPDQFICTSLSSAALNASDPFPGSGTWTFVSSVPAGLPPPAFSTTASDPNTSISVLAQNAGVYRMRWTVTNGLCVSFDEVVVDFGTTPSDPDAGTDRAVCGSSVDLYANTPEKGSGLWSVVEGPGGCRGGDCPIVILTPASATSAVQLKAPYQYGNYTFRWSISSGGNNCFVKADEVTIRFDIPVKVTASDVKELCLDGENPAPVRLQGSLEGSFLSAAWVNISGKGTISESTITDSKVHSVEAWYRPSPDDYKTGLPVQVMLVAQPDVSSVCTRVEQLINIFMEAKPVANAGVDIINICEDHVRLEAITPPYGVTGIWTTSEPGVSFENASDPHTMVRNLPPAPGATVVTWTVTNATGKCVSDPSSIKLTRTSPPMVQNIELTECEVADGTTTVLLTDEENNLTSLPPEQREITWYKNEAPPSGIAITNPGVWQTNVPDGQVYVARIKEVSTVCTSDARVVVHVRPFPKVKNALVSFCEETPGSHTVTGLDLNEAQFIQSITTDSEAFVEWYNSEVDARTQRLPILQPVSIVDSKQFYARVSFHDRPSCFNMARLDVMVTSSPSITSIFGREVVCQGATFSNVEIYQVTPIPGAKYHWEIPNDPNTQFKVFGGGRETDFYVMLQFPNVYTGKIKVTTELNGCGGLMVEKEITVQSAPAKPLIKGSATVCEDNTGISFSVSPNNYPVSAYQWEIRRNGDHSPGGADIIEGQSTGNILVNFGREDVLISVRESNAMCVSPVASKLVSVMGAPKAALTLEKDITCFQERNGIIQTTVKGGASPYSEYRIMETGEIDLNNDGVFDNLGQGSYSVKVRDANGCSATTNTVVLTQPSPISITSAKALTDANGFNVSCKDASDGVITVTFEGGNNAASYTAQLAKAGSKQVTSLQGRSSVVFSNLSAGTYTITVTDITGCASRPSVVFLVEPPPLYGGMIGSDQSICSGAVPAPIDELAPATGGVGNYSYEWQESPTGDITNDADWSTIPQATGVSFHPPVLTTSNPDGERRYYRRLTRSTSTLNGTPTSCEVRGKTEKITIAIHPIPEVSFLANTSEICYGEPLSLLMNLTKGTAPIEYEYQSLLKGKSSKLTGGKNVMIAIPDVRTADTFTLLDVKDANGCTAKQLPPPVTVGVIEVDPTFVVSSADAQCEGSEFEFSWNVAKNIDYRWEWADGTVDDIKAGSFVPGQQKITHKFPIASSKASTPYSIKLFAKHPVCTERFSTQSITVFPAININITTSEDSVCSGETITFLDHSSGVDNGKWYYTASGSSSRVDERQGGQGTVNYSVMNDTNHNPAVYEFVYEAFNNSGCKAIYKKQISVYQGSEVDFQIGEVERIQGELSQVTFTNGSHPLNSDFEYHWEFGQDGRLVKERGTSVDVQYFSAGEKYITLTAVNNTASQMGKSCSSVITKRITIPMQTLSAVFSATPRAACYPVDISINNSSTGADTFLWAVYSDGALITTSNLRNPVFKMTSPGIYDIFLKASYSTTQQSVEAELKGIRVFDIPKADFNVRSNMIYVPDVELQVTNFSTGADSYLWDFGDGNTTDEFEPRHTYLSQGKYNVKLTAVRNYGEQDVYGDGTTDRVLVCYDSAMQEVTAVNGGSIVIPNAFTPSTAGPSGGRPAPGGFNDVFIPRVKGVTAYTLQIFNRWGTMVFESRDASIGWDGYDHSGKLMPAGVYVYRIALTQSDGERTTRIGDVTLIR